VVDAAVRVNQQRLLRVMSAPADGRIDMPSARRAFNEYTASGGLAFYMLGNGKNMIGVRDGSAYTLSKYVEVYRLGLVAGSRAEWVRGPRFPIIVITFADAARHYSREIEPRSKRDAEKEIAEYNHLSGFGGLPAGYVPPVRTWVPHQQDASGVVWSCRFCKTVNKDVPRCDHCGAPR
jgi:hypothetical protein